MVGGLSFLKSLLPLTRASHYDVSAFMTLSPKFSVSPCHSGGLLNHRHLMTVCHMVQSLRRATLNTDREDRGQLALGPLMTAHYCLVNCPLGVE